MFAHLGIVLMAGIYLRRHWWRVFQNVAKLLG